MKVAMLYFSTISGLIKKHGFSWEDVHNIEDFKGRVKFGKNSEFESTLEHIFYYTHMGGFCKNDRNSKLLIAAFLNALEESRIRRRLSP